MKLNKLNFVYIKVLTFYCLILSSSLSFAGFTCKEIAFERVDLDYINKNKKLGSKTKNNSFELIKNKEKIILKGYMNKDNITVNKIGADYIHQWTSKKSPEFNYNKYFRFFNEDKKSYLYVTSIDNLASGPFFKNEIYRCLKE